MKHSNLKLLAGAAAIALALVACGGDEPTEAPPAATAASATDAPVASEAPTTEATEATDTVSGNSGLATASIGDPRPAPELADLVLPDRSTFEMASLEGAPILIYFGYTHCPDVCPATMGELFGVFEAKPETQALFVSVDPERDTPEFLDEWTTYLPDNLYAVTGSPGAVRRAADNYGVKYARVETTSTAGYTMSHTANLYLIDEDGQLLLAYPFGTPAAEIVEDLGALEAA